MVSSSRIDGRVALVAISCIVGCAPAAGAIHAELTTQPSLVTLDVAGDGTELTARVESVRVGTDADRVLTLGPGSIPGLAGAHVLDARFAADGVVVIGVDHVLRFHRRDGATTTLDHDAGGPLSVESDRIAYVHGEPPDLELARADLVTGEVEILTDGMAPVWSPALSPDGSTIVFVSAIEGTPRLHRRTSEGGIEALAPTQRTPSAPTAPRWIDGSLVFEDEAGIAWLDLAQGAITRELEGVHGLVWLGDGRPAATIDGALAPLAGVAR